MHKRRNYLKRKEQDALIVFFTQELEDKEEAEA